ncbi:4461_t:CDS:2 [Cetraspora pellucida]|uniref:4461_t:CDS:1 n=1 Tax=Cetraspora pellucida TaxID=1433469 RepID=A0A9N9NZW6_9GLOM|nr:4461_t:CDS:2 [Cetraspora pellucida]
MWRKSSDDPLYLPTELLNQILTYLPDPYQLTPEEINFLEENINALDSALSLYQNTRDFEQKRRAGMFHLWRLRRNGRDRGETSAAITLQLIIWLTFLPIIILD